MKREKMRAQIFIDPLYGSERYVEFDPVWVVEAEDRFQKLLVRPKVAVTALKFRNGERHLVFEHWAERIRTAQIAAQEAAQAEAQRKAAEAKAEAEAE